jgi:hypothetical protein
MRSGLDDQSLGNFEHLRRWPRRSACPPRVVEPGQHRPVLSFPSTVTSILIRADGRVDFLTRNEDDDVHFQSLRRWTASDKSRCRRDRTVRQRGRAPLLPRRRRSPPSRCRSQPWARSRGSRPPTAVGTSSASSSPIPCPPDHLLRPSTSQRIATSLRFHPRWPRPSSSAMAVPQPADRSGSIRPQEPRGCTSASGTLGLSRVRRASTRITAGRSRWPSSSISASIRRERATIRMMAARPSVGGRVPLFLITDSDRARAPERVASGRRGGARRSF